MGGSLSGPPAGLQAGASPSVADGTGGGAERGAPVAARLLQRASSPCARPRRPLWYSWPQAGGRRRLHSSVPLSCVGEPSGARRLQTSPATRPAVSWRPRACACPSRTHHRGAGPHWAAFAQLGINWMRRWWVASASPAVASAHKGRGAGSATAVLRHPVLPAPALLRLYRQQTLCYNSMAQGTHRLENDMQKGTCTHAGQMRRVHHGQDMKRSRIESIGQNCVHNKGEAEKAV